MKDLIDTEIIEKFMQTNGLSKSAFCKRCKISPSTLKRVLTNGNVKMNALFKIVKVMNIEICRIVVKTEKGNGCT